jgi:hypothetical protein
VEVEDTIPEDPVKTVGARAKIFFLIFSPNRVGTGEKVCKFLATVT